MNRREVLTGIGLAGAVAATPLVGATLAQVVATDSTEWNAALVKYQRADALHTALFDRHWRAEEAASKEEGPRVDRYFDSYGLGTGMSRDDIEYWLARYNTGRSSGRIDVSRTADEFEAYCCRIKASRKKHRLDELWQEAQAHLPKFDAARNRLMAVDAPDTNALLIKIEIAATSLDDVHGESVLADARRLLAGQAA